MTCENCLYRDGEHCVYNPPLVVYTQYAGSKTFYPTVWEPKHIHKGYMVEPYEVSERFEKACSKYKSTHPG